MRNPILFAAAIGLAATSVGASAQARGLQPGESEQRNAYRAAQQGRILTLPEIRSRIRVSHAEYIGAEMIGPTVYRLKYMRGPIVIWIDVDGRTGRIVNRTDR